MVNTIAYYLKRTAGRFPDKVAFRDQQKHITFSELDRQARSLAYIINQRLKGAVKQPIGIYLPKSVDCVLAFMAVIYSGNYYTPLDTAMPANRLEKIQNILQPALILTSGAVKKGVPLHETVLLEETRQAPSDEQLIDKIMDTVIDADILYVMFTSGSTGEPKGVVISHRAVIDYIDWVSEAFEFDENTVLGSQAPFSFDNSVLDIYSAIRNGCETVLIPEDRFLSAGRLCQYVNDNKINAIFWVPSAMALVANADILKRMPMKQLTKILFAGEVMPTRHLNIWRRLIPDALYANLYGPTEIAVDCTYYIVEREFDDGESLPIGGACKNSAILVLNGQDELVSNGETGEICVRGSCLANGYYGNSQKTKEAFVQNPLNDKYPELIYRTGDLGKYNDRGELLYLGRKDYQIKHRGYRIELGEIEAAVSISQSVENCCAIYDSGSMQIVVYVTPETINKKELYTHMKNLLPNYMLPGLIISEQLLPLNPNGKIDRLALMDRIKGEL